MKIKTTVCASFLLVSGAFAMSLLLTHSAPKPSDTGLCLGQPGYCSMPVVSITRLLP